MKNKKMRHYPLAALWREKAIVFELAWNITRNKYQGSYIGFLWIIFEPLLAFSILYIVFSTIRAGAGPDFAVYLFSGLVIFQVFSRGTQNGLSSLRSNEGIMNSMKINKEIFPLSATISSMFMLLIQFGIFSVIALFLNHEFSISLALIPLVFSLVFLLNLGLSYLLSVIFVYVRDIQPIWSIITYAMFFVSPIFWYVKEIDGLLLSIYQINPLGRIIELMHNIVFNQNIDPIELGITIVFVTIILLIGFVVFKRVENRLVQEL